MVGECGPLLMLDGAVQAHAVKTACSCCCGLTAGHCTVYTNIFLITFPRVAFNAESITQLQSTVCACCLGAHSLMFSSFATIQVLRLIQQVSIEIETAFHWLIFNNVLLMLITPSPVPLHSPKLYFKGAQA